ncbi:MAG: hypothetical protein DRP45_00235 [Candidatus Zixiibacteriota bacterium]|nr:MAG: hypothetical protein DRP45_00235 [candidate division Zixibacteria bacterium]
MFSKFKELFTSESLLDKAYTTTVTMLEFDYKMYKAAREVLRELDTATLPFDFKKSDRKINKYEREVRRNVLTHLTVAGTRNLVPGLVLVSIVIDVERIGDYTKNISGLARDHKKALKAAGSETALSKIEATIEEHFTSTIEVLRTQDKKLARKIMRAEDELSKKADRIISDMVKGKDAKLSTGDSVCIALYLRFLKRTNSHLTNIASAIVNPFPRIGFSEKIKKSTKAS